MTTYEYKLVLLSGVSRHGSISAPDAQTAADAVCRKHSLTGTPRHNGGRSWDVGGLKIYLTNGTPASVEDAVAACAAILDSMPAEQSATVLSALAARTKN